MSESPSLWQRIVAPGPTQPAKPLVATGRAGRNLPAAVGTAAVLIGAVVASLVWVPAAFVALVALLCLGACWELAGAFKRVDVTLSLVPLYVGSIGMLVCAWLLGSEATLVAMYLTVFAVIAWRLADGRIDHRTSDVIASTFTVAYVPFLASFVVLILREYGVWALAFYVLVTVLNDLGGWAAGISFGKHPMAPRLSPKKSWEGFAGSVIACLAAGIGGIVALGAHWAWGIAAGLVGCLVGTLGDLTESLIKREVGLKDMSQLLPGHGGVLDRVDALLMSAPAQFLVLSLALGGAA